MVCTATQGDHHAYGLQADRRALNITLNSIGTELTRDDRRKLYSNFGLLYPHGHYELAGAEDFDQIRSAMEKCPPYQAIFTKVSTTTNLVSMWKILHGPAAAAAAASTVSQYFVQHRALQPRQGILMMLLLLHVRNDPV